MTNLIKRPMNFRVAFAMLALSLSGCEEETSRQTNDQKQLYNAERFTVTRVGEFGDNRAYGQTRGIYTLIDRKTGKEFIGLSGIGITEVGSSGKTTAER